MEFIGKFMELNTKVKEIFKKKLIVQKQQN